MLKNGKFLKNFKTCEGRGKNLFKSKLFWIIFCFLITIFILALLFLKSGNFLGTGKFIQGFGEGPQFSSQSLTTIPGEGFFNMSIESFEEGVENITVVTTGARYEVNSTGIEMYRRIDPATNEYNERLVSRLEFDSAVSNLEVGSYDSTQFNITSDKVNFTINSDSFFFVKPNVNFNYSHVNLISEAPWNKSGKSALDRIWTDGYGGSLHAWLEGAAEVLYNDSDKTSFQLGEGDILGHMVFPARKFDFEKLYGENARPFTQSAGYSNMNEDFNVSSYYDLGFGVFRVWNTIYNNTDLLNYRPILLDYPSIAEYPIYGYEVKSEIEQNVTSFIQRVHDVGGKVLFYHYSTEDYRRWLYPVGHPLAGEVQDYKITLQFMEDFKNQYGFDGWYFDNAGIGNLSDDYDFIKKVREMVGNEGIIFHHDSVDIWDNNREDWDDGLEYNGLRAIMIDTYVDYTVNGETGQYLANTHDVNHPYLRYFASGYGLSQAFGSQIILTSGRAGILRSEVDRLMAENLNGAERSATSSWSDYHKPAYDLRRQEYLDNQSGVGYFNPDVSWPIDSATGWFREPLNVDIDFITGTSVNISWQTSEPANSHLTITNDSQWSKHPSISSRRPDVEIKRGPKVMNHFVIVSDLNENEFYEARIRSGNLEGSNEEIVWGTIVNFTTSAADSDLDGMKDDWEIEYFGSLEFDGGDDFDGDGLTNLEEHNLGTNPLINDSDYDGYNDSYEILIGTDPMDWNSPEVSGCFVNNICQKGEDYLSCPEDCFSKRIAYYTFDYGDSKDQSGNNYDGEVVNAIFREDLGVDSSGVFEFTGGNEHIYLGENLTKLDLYSDGGTIIARIKPDDVSRYNIITQHLAGLDYFSAGFTGGNLLMSMIYDEAEQKNYWPKSNVSINSGEWVEVALTFRNGEFKYYINGNLSGEVIDSKYVLHDYSNDKGAYIGYGFGDSTYFYGLIDEISVWNTVLTAEEIKNLNSTQCGDGLCIFDETCSSCEADCGVCAEEKLVKASGGIETIVSFSEDKKEENESENNSVKGLGKTSKSNESEVETPLDSDENREGKKFILLIIAFAILIFSLTSIIYYLIRRKNKSQEVFSEISNKYNEPEVSALDNFSEVKDETRDSIN